MNKPAGISDLLLERYRIGEVTDEEISLVESALEREPALAASLTDMEHMDREFLARRPLESTRILQETERRRQGRVPGRRLFPGFGRGPASLSRLFPGTRPEKGAVSPKPGRPFRIARALSVIFVGGFALTFFVLRAGYGGFFNGGLERAKGGQEAAALASRDAALSAFLRDNQGDTKIEDGAILQAGNTIQLVYQVRPEPGKKAGPLRPSGQERAERYGVIFSVDGRSLVTLHYPYAPNQSAHLETGKATPLDEAYTLDDAPSYEAFFFVVDTEPLDTNNILETAKTLAGDLKTLEDNLRNRYSRYELTTLIFQKESR